MSGQMGLPCGKRVKGGEPMTEVVEAQNWILVATPPVTVILVLASDVEWVSTMCPP